MKKIVCAILCSLALVLALITPADAACRRVAPAAVASNYVAPATVTVTPTFTVSSFLAVPVAQYPLFGVGYGQSDSAAEIRALTAELSLLRQQIAAGVPKIAPRMPPVAAPAASPQAEASAFPDADKVLAAVKVSCARCHSGEKAKGGLSLVGADGRLASLSREQRLAAFASCADGTMPEGGPPVSDETLALFRAWSKSK